MDDGKSLLKKNPTIFEGIDRNDIQEFQELFQSMKEQV